MEQIITYHVIYSPGLLHSGAPPGVGPWPLGHQPGFEENRMVLINPITITNR